MKKSNMMEDLDCAHCASKIEDAISKIDGVNACHVNFLAQKMTLEADDDKFESIVNQAIKITKKIEPDCKIQV